MKIRKIRKECSKEESKEGRKEVRNEEIRKGGKQRNTIMMTHCVLSFFYIHFSEIYFPR